MRKKGPAERILSRIAWLDEGMVRAFQEVANRLGISNFRLAGFCSWLLALTSYMLMVQSAKSPIALLGYMFASAFNILCIFGFKILEDTDETPTQITSLVTKWRDVVPGGVIRTIAMLFVMTFLGGNMYNAARHDSGHQWTKVATILVVIPILYLAAGDPPQQRRKIRIRKRKK